MLIGGRVPSPDALLTAFVFFLNGVVILLLLAESCVIGGVAKKEINYFL